MPEDRDLDRDPPGTGSLRKQPQRCNRGMAMLTVRDRDDALPIIPTNPAAQEDR